VEIVVTDLRYCWGTSLNGVSKTAKITAAKISIAIKLCNKRKMRQKKSELLPRLCVFLEHEVTLSGIVTQRYGGTEIAGSVFLTSVVFGSV
jgi:hypothetical protein